MSDTKRIAVIGAGVSGISVLRRLSENDNFKLTCFEKGYDIGGQWLYTDETSQNIFGQPISSAIYKHLRPNLPKYLMEIKGYEHDDDTPTYLTVPEVHKYLTYVADSSNTRRFISFNTIVEHVEPTNPDIWDTKWQITYRDVRKKHVKKCEIFDWVIICIGVCDEVNYPKVKGEDNFEGIVIHSKQYRHPEMFADQTVAVLGASHSGVDISIDLSKYAKKIYLCYQKKVFTYLLPGSVEEKNYGFKCLTSKTVILENGCELEIDAVIYCTGYRYSFPFLRENIVKLDEKGTITNLFKNTLSVEYNTLAIVNNFRQSAPFYIGDNQALFLRSVIEGKAKLPDRQKQKEIALIEYKNGPINLHTLWKWQRELSEIAGNFPPVSTRLHKIWDCQIDLLLNHLDFRSYVFNLNETDSVTIYKPNGH